MTPQESISVFDICKISVEPSNYNKWLQAIAVLHDGQNIAGWRNEENSFCLFLLT